MDQLVQQKTLLLERMRDLEVAWEEVNGRDRKLEIKSLDDKLWELKEKLSEYDDVLNQAAPVELDEKLTDCKENIEQLEGRIEEIASKLDAKRSELAECENGLLELHESTSTLEAVGMHEEQTITEEITEEIAENAVAPTQPPIEIPTQLNEVREIVIEQETELATLTEREREMDTKLSSLQLELARICNAHDDVEAVVTNVDLEKQIRVLKFMKQVATAQAKQHAEEKTALQLRTELNRALLDMRLSQLQDPRREGTQSSSVAMPITTTPSNGSSPISRPASAEFFRSRTGTMLNNISAKPPPKPPKPDKSEGNFRRRFGTMAV